MPGEHEAAAHKDPDGATKGWNAADVDPSEYSDDDYAAQFEVVTDGAVQD